MENKLEECLIQASCTHENIVYKFVGIQAFESGCVGFLFKGVDVSIRAECVDCGLAGAWLKQKAALPTPRMIRRALKSFYEEALKVEEMSTQLLQEHEKKFLEVKKRIKEKTDENCGRQILGHRPFKKGTFKRRWLFKQD